MDRVEVEAGPEVYEIIGTYNGLIAGLIAILHHHEMIDGRATAASIGKGFETPLGDSFAKTLRAAILGKIDSFDPNCELGGTGGPVLRLVPHEPQ